MIHVHGINISWCIWTFLILSVKYQSGNRHDTLASCCVLMECENCYKIIFFMFCRRPLLSFNCYHLCEETDVIGWSWQIVFGYKYLLIGVSTTRAPNKPPIRVRRISIQTKSYCTFISCNFKLFAIYFAKGLITAMGRLQFWVLVYLSLNLPIPFLSY